MLFKKARQYNIQMFYKIIFFKLGQDKSKLQKQIRTLFILITMTVW